MEDRGFKTAANVPIEGMNVMEHLASPSTGSPHDQF